MYFRGNTSSFRLLHLISDYKIDNLKYALIATLGYYIISYHKNMILLARVSEFGLLLIKTFISNTITYRSLLVIIYTILMLAFNQMR